MATYAQAIVGFILLLIAHYTVRPLIGGRAPVDFLAIAVLFSAVRLRPGAAALLGFAVGLTIDALQPDLGTLAPSPTAKIGLLGADGHERAMATLANHAATSMLPAGGLAHLVARYGSTASEVLDVIAGNPSLAAPIGAAEGPTSKTLPPDPDTFDGAHMPFSGSRYLLGEAVHAATYEGAMHVDDVLTRRTRLSIEGDDRGIVAAPVVASAMGAVLGWSGSVVDQEAKRYGERVNAERAAERANSDQEADDIRRAIRDPRLTHTRA